MLHSSIKYFGSHSDVIGGCVVVNDDELAEKFKIIQVLSGAVWYSFDCWLIARGIQNTFNR